MTSLANESLKKGWLALNTNKNNKVNYLRLQTINYSIKLQIKNEIKGLYFTDLFIRLIKDILFFFYIFFKTFKIFKI